jgi:hypothetical protein
MDINIALDGPRRRNLELFAGDEVTLNVNVYTVDGDLTPIVVTALTISTNPDDLTLPVATPFTVDDNWPGRRWYWLRGEIADNVTTLAYGVIEIFGGEWDTLGGNDYGWHWPYGPYGWYV